MDLCNEKNNEHFPDLVDEVEALLNTNFDLVHRKIDNTYPPVDIFEEDALFRISADLPGMSKEDFRIDLDQNVLTIRGNKRCSNAEPTKIKFYHFERSYGSFSRSFNLPSNADNETIEAFYKDGVLDIIIRKSEPLEIYTDRSLL